MAVNAGVDLPGVSVLRLDGPEGALTGELVTTLRARLAAEAAAGSRVALLTAPPGPVFCSGMDIEAGRPDAEELAEQTGRLFDLLTDLRESPLLTVCAVDGWVSGAGVGLLAASDLVVATPRSRISLPEVLWGLVPWTVLPFLVTRIGTAPARRLACTGLPMSAESAQALGLVDELADDPVAAVGPVARRIARIGRDDLAEVKDYVARLVPVPMDREVLRREVVRERERHAT